MRYWEIIADNLSKAGWSWGCVSVVDSDGRTIWIVDAHRDNGKRLVVRADEKLTAFLELETAIRAASGYSGPQNAEIRRTYIYRLVRRRPLSFDRQIDPRRAKRFCRCTLLSRPRPEQSLRFLPEPFEQAIQPIQPIATMEKLLRVIDIRAAFRTRRTYRVFLCN